MIASNIIKCKILNDRSLYLKRVKGVDLNKFEVSYQDPRVTKVVYESTEYLVYTPLLNSYLESDGELLPLPSRLNSKYNRLEIHKTSIRNPGVSIVVFDSDLKDRTKDFLNYIIGDYPDLRGTMTIQMSHDTRGVKETVSTIIK